MFKWRNPGYPRSDERVTWETSQRGILGGRMEEGGRKLDPNKLVAPSVKASLLLVQSDNIYVDLSQVQLK